MRGTSILRHLGSLAQPSPRQLCTPASLLIHRSRNALVNKEWSRFYARRVPFEPPTMNELPVPIGSWEKNFKKQNDKYNKHLMMGIGFLLFTLFVMSQTVELNFFPPPLPDQDDDLCPPPKQKKC